MLDLKTGYPLEDFSSLVVYFPKLESESFLASAVLAVMGKEKALAIIGQLKGTAAVWIDGSGKETVLVNDGSGAKWSKSRRLF
jgi:thiamine biosynthesis lipoprotein ApbE